MPKIPYKPEKSGEKEDDYEIVSFEDFCDKSPGSKTDLLTLNDNINYRLCFESDKSVKYGEGAGESSRDFDNQTETSLSDPKSGNFKRRLSNSFAPFGKYTGKTGKSSLFSGVIPKAKIDDETPSPTIEHSYHRFSRRANIFQRIAYYFPGFGSGVMVILIVCVISVFVWWAVSGAVGGTWADEHYRRLWMRAHPDSLKAPISPLQLEKDIHLLSFIQKTENRYHDHNNLSTKNRNNATDMKKKEHKKSQIERTPEELGDVCARVDVNMRFDCYPQDGASEAGCVKRGCCWSATEVKGAPYCFYPPQYNTYQFINMTEDRHSMTVYYEKSKPSGYPDDFNLVRIDFKYMSDDILQIKIYDAEHKRFEPPYPESCMVPKPLSKPKYRVMVDGSMTGFKIIRNADNVTIFNAQDVGGLILSDKFLQLSAILPTDHVFGLGEKRARFMNDVNWNTFALFNRDRQPVEGANLYGSHPFYLAVEHDGNSHGTLLVNSNAMDIVLQPTPAITYRTIGGILHFVLLLGPSPRAVVQQYTEVIGRPFMPPYWSLGFHLCRFNYGSVNATRDVWKANRDAGIPFDVQWNDIDYMHDHNDFTYDKDKYAGLPEFVNELHSEGMKYMIIIDPGIGASEKPGTYPPYDRGIEMDIFVKNSTNQPFVGQVWNTGRTVFPDFTHPNSTPYWVEMMSNFHKAIPYDGAWIDMNEPSNFLDGPAYGSCAPLPLPYLPTRAALRTHTLCMDARHHLADHYHVHNVYAISEAAATHYALSEIRGKRPLIISRASSPGLGALAGHWSGDIRSDWHDMRMTIPELLSFSLFGIPLMGADVCGFAGNTTRELCERWMQLGAFYPFSRNHNDDTSIPQDPVSLGPSVVEASRKALRLRYRLLPLYYTLFWRAHVYGDTVATPLFFESPELTDLHDMDSQFLIGSNVMITPILSRGARLVHAYYPPPQHWYWLDGTIVHCGQWMDVDEDHTVAVRGGAVIPLQAPPASGPVSTRRTRSSPMQLLVTPGEGGNAHGMLYWDDGDSINSYQEKKYSHIEFYMNGTEFRSTPTWWGYGVPSLNKITFFDQPPIRHVNINNQPCKKPCEFVYDPKTKVLDVNVNLSMDKQFTVSLVYKQKNIVN